MKFISIFLLSFVLLFSNLFAQDTLLSKQKPQKKKVMYGVLSVHTNFMTNEFLRNTYTLKSYNHLGIGFLAGEYAGKAFFNYSRADFMAYSLKANGSTQLIRLIFNYISLGYVRHTYFHNNIGLRNRIALQICAGGKHNSFGYLATIGLVVRGASKRDGIFVDFGYNRQRTTRDFEKVKDLSCFVFSTGFLF
jgi:hypothetical protein